MIALTRTAIALTLIFSLAAPGAPAAATPSAPPPAVGGSQPLTARYAWPLRPKPKVSRGFMPPAQRWQTGHRGVDLTGVPGQQVLAAGPGVVQFAGLVAGKPTVSVRHRSGLLTTYEPVAASARGGQTVTRGTPLGVLQPGHEGCPVTACLHWGARRGAGRTSAYINPLSLIGALHLRLKPLRLGD